MSQGKTRLVLFFNHKYEKNLEKLDALYGDRFPDALYLMPFYGGGRPDVIPVYDSSFRFEAFFAQSFGAVRSEGYSHYAFVADDLILHPSLTADNLADLLGLNAASAYIKTLSPFSELSMEWPHTRPALDAFRCAVGVEYARELPPYDEAARLIGRHGVRVKGEMSWHNLKGYDGRYHYQWLQLLRAAIFIARRKKIPYPLLMSYADFFVVPASSLKQFCHLCGVFAAIDLFPEVAVPTALALSCERVVREEVSDWRGVEMWAEGEAERFAAEHGFSLRSALKAYGPKQLYLHPVKLSKWLD